MAKIYTLNKAEKLKSRAVIERLFNREGKSFALFPLRVIWLETPLDTEIPVQVAFSVPKKRFKKAVERNRIKRLMREAYRLNKPKFHASLLAQDKQGAVMFLFTGTEIPDFEALSEKMQQILKRLRRIL
jgi:ribonuclease P protein component